MCFFKYLTIVAIECEPRIQQASAKLQNIKERMYAKLLTRTLFQVDSFFNLEKTSLTLPVSKRYVGRTFNESKLIKRGCHSTKKASKNLILMMSNAFFSHNARRPFVTSFLRVKE